MKLEDLKLISKLIHTYGIKEFEKITKINSTLLSYMHETNSKTHSKYSETESSQIFTNGETSIFCLEPKLIDFDVLNTDTIAPMSLKKNYEEIKKYIENANEFFGDKKTKVAAVTAGSHFGMLLGLEPYDFSARNIDLQDLKMVELLLKNYKMYASIRNPIVHVEGENGYAYILGKTSFIKSIF